MTQVKIQTFITIPKTGFKHYARVGVLVDENTLRYCYDSVKKLLPAHVVIKIPAGESNKNLETCQHIWRQLTEYRFDRHSLLIILGGGVAGDMGGFCASTFKRGIDFCLMPTTLLAQVDASIGGKLGIDFGPFKNHIGVFQEPIATYIATDFLKTLPFRELRSGFAEVIKHCLISDKKMWEMIQKKSIEEQSWLKLVKHSTAFKSKVVSKDPKEAGLRKILNFGHTMGHGLEGYHLSTGKSLFHGEAIAAGMVMEARIAFRKKLINQKELKSISEYVVTVFGKIGVPGESELMPLLRQDKKNKGNSILMALPKGIGKAVWDIPVNGGEILDAMEYYRSFQT